MEDSTKNTLTAIGVGVGAVGVIATAMYFLGGRETPKMFGALSTSSMITSAITNNNLARSELQDAYWHFEAATSNGDGDVFQRDYYKSEHPEGRTIEICEARHYKTPMEIAYASGLDNLKSAGVPLRHDWAEPSRANARAMIHALTEQGEALGWDFRRNVRLSQRG
jgi:hypothetical protein